jgi:23S rRNA (guanosine2251-2'-O)-methyltransferase
VEVITGFHAIEEYIKSAKGRSVLYMTGNNKRHDNLSLLAEKQGIKVIKAEQKELDRLSGSSDNRGAVLVLQEKGAKKIKYSSVREFLDTLDAGSKEESIVLLLDGITDPHNFGAILRSADQLGIDLVITPGRRSASDNPTVRKTSAGASEYVSVVEDNLARSMDLLKKKGFWIFGADMAGQECWSLNLKGKTALILGSEGSGISRLLAEKCDSLIKIPSFGRVDSFNVSVAAGILMYETVRQHSGK